MTTKHTRSTSKEYAEAYTNTPGADGSVPYKKDKVVKSNKSALSGSFCKTKDTTSRISKGVSNLCHVR